MTATDSIPSTVLVAIDISKHRHEVLIGVGVFAFQDTSAASQTGRGCH
jgi:hypothetical protein